MRLLAYITKALAIIAVFSVTWVVSCALLGIFMLIMPLAAFALLVSVVVDDFDTHVLKNQLKNGFKA